MKQKLQISFIALFVAVSMPAHAAWFDFFKSNDFERDMPNNMRQENGEEYRLPPVVYYEEDISEQRSNYYTRDDLEARPIFNDGATASYSMRPDGLYDAIQRREYANLLREKRHITQIRNNVQFVKDPSLAHDDDDLALKIQEPKRFRTLTDEEINSGMIPEEWSESKKHKGTIELHAKDKGPEFDPLGTAPKPGDYNYDPNAAYNYRNDPLYHGRPIHPDGTRISDYDNRKFKDPRAAKGQEIGQRGVPDSWRKPIPEEGSTVYLPNVHKLGQDKIQEKYHDTLAQNPEYRRAEPRPYVPTNIQERGNGLFDYNNQQIDPQPEQYGAGISPEQGRVVLDQNSNNNVMPVQPNYVPNGIAQGGGTAYIQDPYSGDDRYIVVPGDSLSGISDKPRIYNDWKLWPLLWDANRDQIEDPDLIHPGQRLGVPRGYSEQEEYNARQRGAAKYPPWNYYDGK